MVSLPRNHTDLLLVDVQTTDGEDYAELKLLRRSYVQFLDHVYRHSNHDKVEERIDRFRKNYDNLTVYAVSWYAGVPKLGRRVAHEEPFNEHRNRPQKCHDADSVGPFHEGPIYREDSVIERQDGELGACLVDHVECVEHVSGLAELSVHA